MSGLEVVGLFLACTDAAVNIVAAVKRRFGAKGDISELTTKCHYTLCSIRTLIDKVDVPKHRTSLLDTVLRQRLEQLSRVECKLKKLERSTSRSCCVKRFWKAQDVAKALNDIANDLDKLLLALENAVLQWEQQNHVEPNTADEIVCIDPTVQGTQMLVVSRVKGDASCLYRSIARSLAHEEQRTLPPRLETADADALRNLAWRIMCVERASEFSRLNIVEGSLRSYCTKMRDRSFFAGKAEILALSHALKTPISVFLDATGRGSLRAIAIYGEEYQSKSYKKIRVVYNGTCYYNALLLIRQAKLSTLLPDRQ